MIPQKLKTNATIYKVLGWIYIIVGVLVGIGLIVGGVLTGDSEAMVGMIIGAVVGGILGIIFGLLYLAIGKGIHNRKEWAKTVGFIFAILMLLSIPIGTILGIILLLGFSDEQSKAWFSGAGNMDPHNYQPPQY
jgi:membrane associated rhomboid family serine protease